MVAERKSIVRPERGIINHTFNAGRRRVLLKVNSGRGRSLISRLTMLNINYYFAHYSPAQCALPLIRAFFEISSRYPSDYFVIQREEKGERKGGKREKMDSISSKKY